MSVSYRGFAPASSHASRCKQNNQPGKTRPELLLRRALWARGLRYRIANNQLPGRPDLTFGRCKVAVFVDGDYWHGKDWDVLRERLASRHNAQYWISKIEYNRSRDLQITQRLEDAGWRVMRVWESDIYADIRTVVKQITRTVKVNPAKAVLDWQFG